MAGEFSVAQFLVDGRCEYVREQVDGKEAVEAAYHYTHNVAAKLGLVERVIITDGGDHTCFEWLKGKGVTWPPRRENP